MITFFRSFFQSKLGIAVTLAFLGLIAVAFASSDVANTGMFGGVTGGDRMAVIGDRRISTADLQTNVNNALQQARESDPTLTMEEFIAAGGLDDVLEQMISRSAISEFGHEIGLRAGDRLVDSEIVNIPAFQGLDGNFSAEAFRQALRQRSLSEATVRDDLAQGLFARQLVLPLGYGARLPDSLVRRYSQLITDTRLGTAAPIPAALFAPEDDPTDEQLQSYYNANRADYIEPERRVLRYVPFDINAVGDLPPITDAQVAARYEEEAANFAPTEQRSFTQLVLPTEAAAQAVIDEVEGGMSLETSAQAKGLSTSTLSQIERADLAEQASPPVAAAGFDADEGALVGPVRGDLGWYVLRVDDVTQISGQTLAQATPEIREELQQEQRQQALNDLTARLEDDFADGRSLTEAADELGIEIVTTPRITSDGRIYGTQQSAPPALARVIDYAFEMQEGADPQLVEIVPGEQFLLFDVSEIVPSAAAPLDEIRDQVVLAWRRDQGMIAARDAAARILDRVNEGSTLAEAVAAEDVDLPSPEPLRINRRELAQQNQLSRASLLFFTMAEGTTKSVRVPETSTYFVMQLDEIQTAEMTDEDPVVVSTRDQLAQASGEEYLQQFLDAAEDSFEVETNSVAIEAVRAQLTGSVN